MNHIVIFGAGKSSTFLIEYLVRQLPNNPWRLTVVDADRPAAQAKIGNAENTDAVAIDVKNDQQRQEWVRSADLIISLLPPSLHYLIATDCVLFGKNLLTASYIDAAMEGLRLEIEKQGLLFLCEMGLDPGIDHMSAMKIIHRLQDDGAEISSFRSHCGGLVAPESDNNPWHYKLSWNPRNVVLAGKAGAVFKENNSERTIPYEQLFDSRRIVNIPGLGDLSWYANRDSLSYINLYDLHHVKNFIRTTLRHPEFCFGWKNLVQLKFTDETPIYPTDGMTLKQFFLKHLNKNGFSEWMEKTAAEKMNEASLSMKQLFFLGMDDDISEINKGLCSAADILQFAMEKNLALLPEDRDMIVMLHEIDYIKDEQTHTINSSLIVKGENNIRTAMAKTVGLPLGIAAKMILQGKIKTKGLHIPILPEIYEPVLKELEESGIQFFES